MELMQLFGTDTSTYDGECGEDTCFWGALAVQNVFWTDVDVLCHLLHTGPQRRSVEPGHPPGSNEDEESMHGVIGGADDATNPREMNDTEQVREFVVDVNDDHGQIEEPPEEIWEDQVNEFDVLGVEANTQPPEQLQIETQHFIQVMVGFGFPCYFQHVRSVETTCDWTFQLLDGCL